MEQNYKNNPKKQNSFMNYQLQEIEYAKWLCQVYDDLEFRKSSLELDQYAPWDVTMESGGTIVLLTEVKCRDFNSDKYEEALLEKQKVDEILKIVEDWGPKFAQFGYNLVGYYLAFYSDVTIGWVITGEERVDTVWAPKTTAGDQTKIEKLTSFFPIEKGEKFYTYY